MSADDAMEEYAVTGAATAFERLYDALAPRLLTYLRRRTRDLAHAEDLLQQCFLQIHRARGCFVRGSKVAPWAFAIARRLAVDHARRAHLDALEGADDGSEQVPSPGGALDEQLAPRELLRRLDRALQTLPAKNRVAFEMVALDGLSLEEAAQVLDTTVNTVKMRKFYAMTALREMLGDDLVEFVR
jgi:RNA polymerase sigma-70 factor (ECF subfamily)